MSSYLINRLPVLIAISIAPLGFVIIAWHVDFVVFTMSDKVIHLKDIIEHLLFVDDFHLSHAHVEPPVEGQTIAVRDLIMSVLFFIGNAVASGAQAFIFFRIFSVMKKNYSS
ncbi:hypothetical protein ACMS09_002425 [Cronobacter malonaticus]